MNKTYKYTNKGKIEQLNKGTKILKNQKSEGMKECKKVHKCSPWINTTPPLVIGDDMLETTGAIWQKKRRGKKISSCI